MLPGSDLQVSASPSTSGVNGEEPSRGRALHPSAQGSGAQEYPLPGSRNHEFKVRNVNLHKFIMTGLARFFIHAIRTIG